MAIGRKRALNPDGVAVPLKPYYSNATRVGSGPLLFVSGQVALNAEGKLVGEGDLRAQAVQVHENIKAILESEGAAMADIVKVTVYVTDIRAFNDIADIREGYFPSDGPASVICEVSALAWPEFMIEVEAVAVAPRISPARRLPAMVVAALLLVAAGGVAISNLIPRGPAPLSSFPAHFATTAMSAEDIRSLMGGMKIEGTTRRGDRTFVIVLKTDGTAEVRIHESDRNSDIRIRDSGKWFAKTNSFCYHFSRFARGRVRCPVIVGKQGKVYAVRGNGKPINWKLSK